MSAREKRKDGEDAGTNDGARDEVRRALLPRVRGEEKWLGGGVAKGATFAHL